MARSALTELDLFNNAKRQSSAVNPPIFERRRSFRDVTSKINPEILKNVIANISVLPTPKETQISPLPVRDPTLGLSFGSENKAETGAMTIFYNGMVAVFDVSPQKAKDVFKLAQENVLPKPADSSESHSYDNKNLLKTLYGDLPLARRKSLQRFLEKRKERLDLNNMVRNDGMSKHQARFLSLPYNVEWYIVVRQNYPNYSRFDGK